MSSGSTKTLILELLGLLSILIILYFPQTNTMDPRAKAASELFSFLLKQGLIIFSSTAASGIMLGPAGLAVGAAAGGAGATIYTVMQSSAWRYFAAGVTAFMLNVLPHFFSMEYITNMLNALARLVVRMLRRAGLLPASELHRAISYPPGPRPGDRDDGPSAVH